VIIRLASVLLAGTLAAGAAYAQTGSDVRWPERPIRFIVPFSAGSSSDTVARLVGQKLGERLGQHFVIENRVGAGGGIGTEQVARAEPDGYTVGLANTSTHAVAASLASLSYDPVKDFAPVSMLGSSPFLLALYPGVAAKTVPELIALAKAKPRAMNYASAGPATLAHLSGALFAKMAKIELTHVPYRGTAQSTLDLLEGRVEMQFGTIPPTLAHIRAGRLRALAVTGAARNATLPDVPTVAESGLPGYESSLWQAIVVPAATAPAIVARLNRSVALVLNEPEVRDALAKQGVEAEPGSPEALAARIRDDVQKWRDVITSAGVRAP
jgi:tripartite-type tricarboxylate transporter receptor subunit TctC